MMNTEQFSYETVTSIYLCTEERHNEIYVIRTKMLFLTKWLKKRQKSSTQPEPPIEIPEFFEAVFEGDIDTVRRCLERGERADQISPFGPSALSEAVLKDRTEVACLLLSYGANPNGNSEFHTPLCHAVGNQNIALIRVLLEYGADINAGVGADGSVLHTAVQRGDIEIVQLLLNNGIELALTDEDGEDALTYARLCWDYWKTEPRAEIVKILERVQVI